MPLNTNLLRGSAGIELPDQLSRMATVEQIRSAQMNQETARLNQQAREQALADAAEAKAVLSDASARIKAAGGPENTREAIAQMQTHPNKTVREVGAKLKQHLDVIDRQDAYDRAHPGKVVVGSMAAPGMQPMQENNLAPQTGVAQTNALIPDQFRQQLDTERQNAAKRARFWEMQALEDPKFAPQAKEARDYFNSFGGIKEYGTDKILMSGGVTMATPAAKSTLSKLIAERDALPPGDSNRKIYEAEILKQTTHPAPVNVNVSTEKAYGGSLAGALAKSDVDLRDAALNAPEAANNANRVLDVLSKGNIIAGPGAEWKLKAAKLLNVVGKNNEEIIANTEQLQKDLAAQTLDAIKTSGLGAGAGFTNADRDFLEKARSGNIEMQPETLRRTAELARKSAEATANKWNTRAKQIPKSAIQGTGLSVEPVVLPSKFEAKKAKASTSKAPSGVDQSIWDVMTPEEKKLWQ